MKTITFYSYKGGVGRSLALSNIAKRLSEFGKKVCLIDFDLEAPGLHHKFKAHGISTQIVSGLVDYISYFTDQNETPPSLIPYTVKISFGNRNHRDIDLIPAGNIYVSEYWKKLSSINWNGLFYDAKGQGIELFLDLKQRIKTEINPDFLLIDSRTGITEISGITMSLLADEVVILAANNEENIEGSKQILKALSIPENNFGNTIPKINLVISRIPYFKDPQEKVKETRIRNSVKRKVDDYLLANNVVNSIDKVLIIHSDPDLEVEEKFKMGYAHERGSDVTSPIAIDYLELFEELTKNELTTEEKEVFNKIVQSELLVKQASEEKDNLLKIKLLKNASLLNPKSEEILFQLILAHTHAEDHVVALEILDSVLALPVGDSQRFNFLKGEIFLVQRRLDEAESIFLKTLDFDPVHYGALIKLSQLYFIKRRYEDSLKHLRRLLDFYADDTNALNLMADLMKAMNKYKEAFEYIYKALELDSRNAYATGTLAELYAHTGNDHEFFKNLDLSFYFGLTETAFIQSLEYDEVYKKYFDNSKFLDILFKYGFNIDRIVNFSTAFN